jgi:hypothetical protein
MAETHIGWKSKEQPYNTMFINKGVWLSCYIDGSYFHHSQGGQGGAVQLLWWSRISKSFNTLLILGSFNLPSYTPNECKQWRLIHWMQSWKNFMPYILKLERTSWMTVCVCYAQRSNALSLLWLFDMIKSIFRGLCLVLILP